MYLFVIDADEKAEQGYRHMQIARTLNDKGIPSPKEHKKRIGLLKRSEGERITFWNSSIVSKIIHDEQYIGHLIYGKRRVIEVGKDKYKHMPRSELNMQMSMVESMSYYFE